MNRSAIIESLDAEIERLKHARQILAGHNGVRPVLGSGRRRKRYMSAEARARIGAAQRARWARVKARGKKN